MLATPLTGVKIYDDALLLCGSPASGVGRRKLGAEVGGVKPDARLPTPDTRL
jgi:hypothetical protein